MPENTRRFVASLVAVAGFVCVATIDRSPFRRQIAAFCDLSPFTSLSRRRASARLNSAGILGRLAFVTFIVVFPRPRATKNPRPKQGRRRDSAPAVPPWLTGDRLLVEGNQAHLNSC
jgi:hypothetical protein